MKQRQNTDLENDDSATLSSSEAAAHIRRMRKVTLFEGTLKWQRKFRAALPMFLLINQGVLIVRRAGMTRMAFKGDVILLTPGRFDLTAVPDSADGIVRLEYAKIPLAVFGKMLSRGSTIEEIAVGVRRHEEYKGIHILTNMLPQVTRNLQIPNTETTVIESVINTLIVSLSPAVFAFLRSVFYERRWAFLGMMEAHTLQPRPVAFLAANYADGRAAYFRDCQLYTGHTPAKWFVRRQMQLADAWIHVTSRKISDVAARLHYDDAGLFRAAFRRHFHRPPENPGPLLSGGSLSLDHPFCPLRPFWWAAPLPLLRSLRALDYGLKNCQSRLRKFANPQRCFLSSRCKLLRTLQPMRHPRMKATLILSPSRALRQFGNDPRRGHHSIPAQPASAAQSGLIEPAASKSNPNERTHS